MKDEEHTYIRDAKKDPAEIDIRRAGEKAPELWGIYKIEGDTLIVCVTDEGERPKRFESPEGSTIRLITCKRELKK
jgi:uncharacterized protein (TIGR03067 family)